jgi:hypothetical protein
VEKREGAFNQKKKGPSRPCEMALSVEPVQIFQLVLPRIVLRLVRVFAPASFLPFFNAFFAIVIPPGGILVARTGRNATQQVANQRRAELSTAVETHKQST